jgi:hypothetical protein
VRFWDFSARLPMAVDARVQIRRRMQVAISGALATMEPAISCATACKLAFPQRRCRNNGRFSPLRCVSEPMARQRQRRAQAATCI